MKRAASARAASSATRCEQDGSGFESNRRCLEEDAAARTTTTRTATRTGRWIVVPSDVAAPSTATSANVNTSKVGRHATQDDLALPADDLDRSARASAVPHIDVAAVHAAAAATAAKRNQGRRPAGHTTCATLQGAAAPSRSALSPDCAETAATTTAGRPRILLGQVPGTRGGPAALCGMPPSAVARAIDGSRTGDTDVRRRIDDALYDDIVHGHEGDRQRTADLDRFEHEGLRHQHAKRRSTRLGDGLGGDGDDLAATRSDDPSIGVDR